MRKFKKSKLRPSFMDNIWDIDLTGTQLISKYNIGIHFFTV